MRAECTAPDGTSQRSPARYVWLLSFIVSVISPLRIVRSFRRMRVIGIGRVRHILPHVGLTESFLLKSSREFLFVHRIILANAGQFES